MKVYDVTGALNGSGEHILGSRETGSHACYLIYGELGPGEQGRTFKPGAGHEEIVLVLQGDLTASGAHAGMIRQGQAVHLRGEETIVAGNPGAATVRYVIAGGHSGEGHH